MPPPHPLLKHMDLFVFDFDGTLIDSLPDIAFGVNQLRQQHSLPALALSEVQAGIGEGARRLLECTAGELLNQGVALETLYDEFLGHYSERSKQPASLYPFAREIVAASKLRGACALLTNKPHEPTMRSLQALDWTEAFSPILCYDNAPAPKPSGRGLQEILNYHGKTPTQAVMIGDSESDFLAGREAGVLTVGLKYGYHRDQNISPDIWATDLKELAAFAALDLNITEH